MFCFCTKHNFVSHQCQTRQTNHCSVPNPNKTKLAHILFLLKFLSVQWVILYYYSSYLVGWQRFRQVDNISDIWYVPQVLAYFSVMVSMFKSALSGANWVTTPVRTDDVDRFELLLAVDATRQGPPARPRGQGIVIKYRFSGPDVSTGHEVPINNTKLISIIVGFAGLNS